MLSNINVVNIVLAAILIAMSYSMLLPLFGKSAKLTLPAPKKQAVATAAKADKPAESKSPSPSDFFLIAEQNLFHPERKIPVEKKEAPPLPKPEFVLYGTLLLDDLRVAYMEDRKAPQNAPTRGKKQIPLKQGEALSGFVLKEVQPDKVVMVRGDEKIDVHLDDPSKSKTRESVMPAVAAAPGAQGAPGQQHAPAPTPAAGILKQVLQGQPAAAAQSSTTQPAQQTQPLQRAFRQRSRTSNYNVQ